MRKYIITTIVLVAAAVLMTVVYFKNLSIPGQHATKVIQSIPADAAVIFEFNNDKGFYDIFGTNELLPSFAGKNMMAELNVLKAALLNQPALAPYFDDQRIFISLHVTGDKSELLLTARTRNDFNTGAIDELIKQHKNGMVINPVTIAGHKGYTIYFSALQKRFFLLSKGDNLFTGSFSKELAARSASYNTINDDNQFVLMPEQQSKNALANLYVNYAQLSPLFGTLFRDKNAELFKSFRMLPAMASLTLNYKTDALMFNGYTHTAPASVNTYLKLFNTQGNVVNRLRNIFPATTAYSLNFAIADPKKFENDLSKLQNIAGLEQERNTLYNKLKSETGVELGAAFSKQLSNEFGTLTTRFDERIAIIQLKNGSNMRPYLVNISNMVNDDIGQFNYDKLPFFLLGDPFSIYKRPYFRIVDNYLLLANSVKELDSYYDTYMNNRFLNKADDYNRFEDLMADRSNATFFVLFKNMRLNLGQTLKPTVFSKYENDSPGWKNYMAAAYQLTSSEKDFYTNFCMQLNKPDTTSVK
jgi:hypothetical protein